MSWFRRSSAGPVGAGVIAVAAAVAATSGGAGVVAPGEDKPDDRAHRAGAARPVAENVIFFVGDGMASAHRNAGRLASVGLHGELVMDTLPYVGRVHTSSADPEDFVTDSAAAATAYASGVKTFNGAIGVDLRGNRVTTVLERAEAAGKSTGLVTTSQVTDATPAAFGAHVADRGEQSEIARQFLVRSRPEVILGGGEDWWFPPANPGAFPDQPAADPSEGSQGTEGNLVRRAIRAGYTYVHDLQGLRRADGPKLLGLFANEEMFQQAPEGEGDVYDPVVPLPAMTTKALNVLDRDPQGFFLMVEEEAIDEMAHNNNARRTLQAVRQLDRAVAIAKDYALRHPGTLVITTGDHETGGLSVESVDSSDESGTGVSAEDGPFPVAQTGQQFTMDWTTTSHTNGDVPLTALGPGARRLTGTYENTHVHDVMVSALIGGRWRHGEPRN